MIIQFNWYRISKSELIALLESNYPWRYEEKFDLSDLGKTGTIWVWSDKFPVPPTGVNNE